MDASYAAHHNMKVNTGGATSMGLSLLHDTYSKSKINTKSFTGTELVGASDYIP